MAEPAAKKSRTERPKVRVLSWNTMKVVSRVSLLRAQVVLAYSGGLDTSTILVWLVEKGFDVIWCLRLFLLGDGTRGS